MPHCLPKPSPPSLELTLGNQWGVGGSLIVGIIQGLGAEIAFAVFAWKKWNIGTTILSGALAGVGCWAYYWATNPGWNGLRVTWYLVGSIISGVVIAGVVVWYLSRALAVTGALERFESGRSKARV